MAVREVVIDHEDLVEAVQEWIDKRFSDGINPFPRIQLFTLRNRDGSSNRTVFHSDLIVIHFRKDES